ncbi:MULTISPECIES: YciI family protein [Prochlorococcus]|uniref:Uncharacterized YCII family conserved protein n=1 Tax=Prochlorococcus marinus (strain SARG / CCMP1375 / SS120) TaxID=167539 RepID=Q7VA00_PROMA|nr:MULTISPECIES: YciI family protein [Prochlorococcus]AAQ00713.1 Uncharacterized YCII family conserved protein [Prochlorococcus marinus subsp. marinus str. CCMP1375]KGG10790.1 putative YCII family conserved protein [Prochlorococcus marinus str. LG]KGG20138.1 putative YCII family conserved protein [Prochlorococcus marinus str. SS2]KGG24038.1 putative YCII family conserved protein [Prochlorococcus marinus str. SS35]KGG31703.1 putative YCII family conserved protein [Prochlorococcus marinus str. S
MPLFIKKEQFTQETLSLLPEIKKQYLADHKIWVKELIASGKNISSGYLTDQERNPGGGGLLFIEATNFEEAKDIIQQDPMIRNNLVNWEIQEWVPVAGNLLEQFNVDKFA